MPDQFELTRDKNGVTRFVIDGTEHTDVTSITLFSGGGWGLSKSRTPRPRFVETENERLKAKLRLGLWLADESGRTHQVHRQDQSHLVTLFAQGEQVSIVFADSWTEAVNEALEAVQAER